MHSNHQPLLPAARPTAQVMNTLFPAQVMNPNSEGIMSTSKLPNYGNSNSAQPPVNLKNRLSSINTKTPKSGPPSNLAAQLGMESRRLDLVWSETINQLKNKHGAKFTRTRSRDTSFRQKIESGASLDDTSANKRWRAMWKFTNACWTDAEVRWMKEDLMGRTGFLGADYRSYTTYPYFENMSITDVDRVMSGIFSYFAAEMGKRGHNTGRTQLEELKQTKRILRDGVWRLILECESESHCSPDKRAARDLSTENNWVLDDFAGPNRECTGATNVVLQSSPAFQPSSSCITATTMDSRTVDGSLIPLLTTVVNPPAPEQAHNSYKRSTNKSRNDPEASAQDDTVRIQAGKQCSETRKGYSRGSSNKYEYKVHCTSGHQRQPTTAVVESCRSHLSSSSISTRNVPQMIGQINPLLHAEQIGKLQREKSDTTSPMVGKQMSVNEIVEHLFRRGCGNLTDSLDQTTFGNFPVSYSGISDVYRGRLLAGTQIAVKALRVSEGRIIIEDHAHLKHAARELYAWSKCKHRNVQQLLGLAMFRGRIAMIFPWTSHNTLPRYLQSAYDVDRCNLCAQICDGLSYLHSVNIVHGDLKGANVIVLADGTPILAEFGNFKLGGWWSLFSEATRRDSLAVRWAAPELLQETGNQSKAADVYALGMTMLEVITGKPPFIGKSDLVVVNCIHQRTHPERPSKQLPPKSRDGNKFWKLLTDCWVYEPDKRPSATEATTIMRSITPYGLVITNTLL
ncbi:unnamed protein product [Rhizoctonia solani]|uniref:Protein kinase domain-containing protein n=1 Tax=Rhizoctonia solani TaxID=456999 RepID=A0A8H3CN34_9AGAM|nr:unnamed protein product [Rhizoctonia solani]